MAETTHQSNSQASAAKRTKSQGPSHETGANNKRHCVSTACIACRKRKSKCDGITPSCAACVSVYGTECVYDPSSDHRRKGVYKEKIDSLKTRNSTLQTLIQAIIDAAEDDVPALVQQIRTCESLDDVAEAIIRQQHGIKDEEFSVDFNAEQSDPPTFETQLSGKMGELRLENGSVRFLGGTSNLIYIPPTLNEVSKGTESYQLQVKEPLTSWSTVTTDENLVTHLINLYFTYHFPFFATLSKSLFLRDFLRGKPPLDPGETTFCSPLLVNAMLALGCHFTSSPSAYANINDLSSKGDAFIAEARRLIVENNEYEKPRLTTVQALCLMSVREAGCGREQKGWAYSGMSFRMAQDLGLNLDSGGITASKGTLDEEEIDARRITFWGCFLFDKCWSNYLGRMPQLLIPNITQPKYDVFPDEESDMWSPYTDSGLGQTCSQPSRTRAVGLQISSLSEINSDILIFFYRPQQPGKPVSKSAELKKLSELHTRLEAWRINLPIEFILKEGQLPNVLLMHMLFHSLHIHLFRPFLKYPPQMYSWPISPRKMCIQAASTISKIMRLYRKTYGLRQICNIAVYFLHTACIFHLLNLSETTARRDIVYGMGHLEEIGEDWLCARRTLSMLDTLAQAWGLELPQDATIILNRTNLKFGHFSPADVPNSRSPSRSPQATYDDVATPPFKQTESMVPTIDAYDIEASPNFIQPQASAFIQIPEQLDGFNTQVTPSSTFGDVETLANSQNWWLEDQTAFAAGFSSWDKVESSVGDTNNINNGYFTPESQNEWLRNKEWYN